jgi:hypothetical protein
MPNLDSRARGRQKKIALGQRALDSMDKWIALSEVTARPDPIRIAAGFENSL